MLNINNNILNNIIKYCKLNGITDIDGEINRMLEIGYNITLYSNSPFDRIRTEKTIKVQEIQEVQVISSNTESIKEDKIEEIKPQIVEQQQEEEKPKRKYTKKVRIIKHE